MAFYLKEIKKTHSCNVLFTMKSHLFQFLIISSSFDVDDLGMKGARRPNAATRATKERIWKEIT